MKFFPRSLIAIFSLVVSSPDAAMATGNLGVAREIGNWSQIAEITFESKATTGVGGGTFDVNNFLGADRYYNHSTPITGQNTVTTNLEAGHIWNGHESLQHVTQFINSSDTWDSGNVVSLRDRHATWVAMLIGGRPTLSNPNIRQIGMASGTDLRSAAIATEWSENAYALSFDISVNSYLTAYNQSYQVSDVINTSYGYSDPAGIGLLTIYSDAKAFDGSETVHVASAGNSGPGSNTVGAPGSGYNTITVAALDNQGNTFSQVAGFSSRGPQDFGYFTGSGNVIIPGVRAAVDIAAPGVSITTAFYGGQTGGNNPTLTGSSDQGSVPDAYSAGVNGTSFSSPIVAGGAALVQSAAKTLPELSSNPYATHSQIVKAILMTGADKTAGWSNALDEVTVNGDTYLQTTQSLDYDVGAGRMNLDRSFDIQVNGQRDVPGITSGFVADVNVMGWDFANIEINSINDYRLENPLQAGTEFVTTLAWMRARFYDEQQSQVFEIAQADLSLSVWSIDNSNNFDTLIAISESDYNNVEHLAFLVPETGFYGIRVTYLSNIFDNTAGSIWGTDLAPQEYGLAWHAVPEPSTGLLLACAIIAFLVLRRKRAGC